MRVATPPVRTCASIKGECIQFVLSCNVGSNLGVPQLFRYQSVVGNSISRKLYARGLCVAVVGSSSPHTVMLIDREKKATSPHQKDIAVPYQLRIEWMSRPLCVRGCCTFTTNKHLRPAGCVKIDNPAHKRNNQHKAPSRYLSGGRTPPPHPPANLSPDTHLPTSPPRPAAPPPRLSPTSRRRGSPPRPAALAAGWPRPTRH